MHLYRTLAGSEGTECGLIFNWWNLDGEIKIKKLLARYRR